MPRHAHAHRCVAAACILGSLALVGCQASSSSKHGDSSFNVSMTALNESGFSQRHQFYYYPDAGIYRDCDEDRWLWSEDGGMTWTFGRRLPTHLEPGNEIPFAVFLSANEPAYEHQAIAAAYPATSAEPATVTVQGSNDFEN